MEIQVKSLCIAATLLVVFAALNGANGAGECGEATNAEEVARRMISCAPAAKNADTPVAAECCTLATKLSEYPACMCAVAFSETVKGSGGKPEIAVTIPQRCGIASRPVGYKCGAYGIP